MARSTSTSGACDSVSAASGVADTESYASGVSADVFLLHMQTRRQAALLCCSICVWIDINASFVLHAYTLYPYAQMQPYEFHVFGLFQPRFEPIFTCFHRLRHRISSDSQSPARNPLIN